MNKKIVLSAKAIALAFVFAYVPKACEMNRVSNIVEEMPHEMYSQIQDAHKDWDMEQIANFYADNKDSLCVEMQNEAEWESNIEEYKRAHPEENSENEVCQDEIDGLNTSAMWLSYCEKYGINPQHPTEEEENKYLDVWCETDEAEELAIQYAKEHKMNINNL